MFLLATCLLPQGPIQYKRGTRPGRKCNFRLETVGVSLFSLAPPAARQAMDGWSNHLATTYVSISSSRLLLVAQGSAARCSLILDGSARTEEPITQRRQTERGVLGLRNCAKAAVATHTKEAHRPCGIRVEESIVHGVAEHGERTQPKRIGHPTSHGLPLTQRGWRTDGVAGAVAPCRIDGPLVRRVGLGNVHQCELASDRQRLSMQRREGWGQLTQRRSGEGAGDEQRRLARTRVPHRRDRRGSRASGQSSLVGEWEEGEVGRQVTLGQVTRAAPVVADPARDRAELVIVWPQRSRGAQQPERGRLPLGGHPHLSHHPLLHA